MSHCDAESLALMSLGENVMTSEERLHLRSCAMCQTDLSSLRSVVGSAQSGPPVALLDPPPEVWHRIRDELDLSLGEASDEAGERASTGLETPTPVAEDEPGAKVVSLDEHRARRSGPGTWLLAAAGVGGILVGGVITASVVGSSGEQDLTVATTVDLEPLPDWDTAGTADLAVNEDGQQVLVVSLNDSSAGTDGYQEVWLIDENVEGMVSLGILEGSDGQFVVPDGVDVASFPIVDISNEPFDGDPTHSGDSITRGQIEV